MTSTSPNWIEWVSVIRAFADLFRLPVGMLAAVAGCATIYVLDAATPLQLYLLTATVLSQWMKDYG